MRKVKLKIEGMHCTSCPVNIDMDLEDLDGVKSAKTSYAKAVIEIEFDEKRISLNGVLEQIGKTGYKASHIQWEMPR